MAMLLAYEVLACMLTVAFAWVIQKAIQPRVPAKGKLQRKPSMRDATVNPHLVELVAIVIFFSNSSGPCAGPC